VLIFDEVKTGITAGWGGATGHYGVQPDLVTLAKSIGGGLPIGAFGGRSDIMDGITTGDVLHLGTYNGNPLVMAAALAVLRDVCTRPAIDAAIVRNRRMVRALDAVIATHDLPAHTVRLGAKGCVTWARRPVRNYRDYKATDFDLAYLTWLWCMNRGVLLPPGLDDQWLVSIMHTDDDLAEHVEVFASLADALAD
jgi:glutamate-1-semialdehyde 2,1-aminomutase